MKKYVRVTGPAAHGVEVGAAALHALLELLLNGAKQALRVRTEGRSSARGHRPAWIEVAAEAAVVGLAPGSSMIVVDAPSLLEAVPRQFQQVDLFPELDAERSAFDYLVDSLEAALTVDGDSTRYDRSMLKFFRQRETLFTSYGVASLEFGDEPGTPPRLRVERGALLSLRKIETQIPPPQQIRLAGRLNSIRHSDMEFSLVVADATVRGFAEANEPDDLAAFWGKDVVVTGEAHFTLKGDIQRIEGARVTAASGNDLLLWDSAPNPVILTDRSLRRPQGPRSGLNAVFGKWPGEETDQEVSTALDALS